MSFLTTVAQTYSTYSYDSDLSSGASVALGVGTILFSILISLIGYVVSAYLLSRIFKKAGLEQWAAWVPVYNVWKTLELGGQQGWWSILMFIPIVNIVAIVFYYIALYHIGLGFGKESWFVVLAIFLPIVWFIWLAFDDSSWSGATPTVTPADQTPTPPAATA